MGFLDKINYSMIVNAFKQVCNRKYHEVFFMNVLQVTVSGIPQDWQVGGSSPDNKYEWVRREWPIWSLLSSTES